MHNIFVIVITDVSYDDVTLKGYFNIYWAFPLNLYYVPNTKMWLFLLNLMVLCVIDFLAQHDVCTTTVTT